MPRWCDALLAAVLLVVLSPVLLLVAVVVGTTTTGPVLFRQVRLGKDGVPFALLKFRTMVVSAEQGSCLTIGADLRITRVGRPLRQHRLDELPQLVNVVRGEMALVGPRPELPGFLSPRMAGQLLGRRPGLTDPASLRYLDEAEVLARQPDPEAYYREVLLPEKARVSADYAQARTAWTDLLVLLRTARCLAAPRKSVGPATLGPGVRPRARWTSPD
ncbi:MAG: putative sugar transferase [Frankiales bacterium]|nr:putative sugar transferase [Frankiales bacterium]